MKSLGRVSSLRLGCASLASLSSSVRARAISDEHMMHEHLIVLSEACCRGCDGARHWLFFSLRGAAIATVFLQGCWDCCKAGLTASTGVMTAPW